MTETTTTAKKLLEIYEFISHDQSSENIRNVLHEKFKENFFSKILNFSEESTKNGCNKQLELWLIVQQDLTIEW